MGRDDAVRRERAVDANGGSRRGDRGHEQLLDGRIQRLHGDECDLRAVRAELRSWKKLECTVRQRPVQFHGTARRVQAPDEHVSGKTVLRDNRIDDLVAVGTQAIRADVRTCIARRVQCKCRKTPVDGHHVQVAL